MTRGLVLANATLFLFSAGVSLNCCFTSVGVLADSTGAIPDRELAAVIGGTTPQLACQPFDQCSYGMIECAFPCENICAPCIAGPGWQSRYPGICTSNYVGLPCDDNITEQCVICDQSWGCICTIGNYEISCAYDNKGVETHHITLEACSGTSCYPVMATPRH